MTNWRELVLDNPMLIEIKRFRRKFLSGGQNSGMHITALVLFGLCYIGLLMLIGSSNGSIPPSAIIMIQSGIMTLGAPAILNASIAGEREKRTWDLLLVAPITRSQILIGKFVGAMGILLIGVILFLVPVLLCAVSYREPVHPDRIFLAELDSICFAVLTCCVSLFFSARCRRPFVALGISLGVLLCGLVIYPALVGSAMMSSDFTRDFSMILHPFYVQVMLANEYRYDSSSLLPPEFLSLLQCGIFLGLSWVVLMWTEKTLTFSDNEVKFLPKKRDA